MSQNFLCLSCARVRRNLATFIEQNDDYFLTKTILRSYGYGLPLKRLIFQARTELDRARAQLGAAWRCFLCRHLACLEAGRVESRLFFHF